MPSQHGRARRVVRGWQLAAAFFAGALVAGIAVAVLVQGNGSMPKSVGPPGIDMSQATGLSCAAPVPPGQGHQNTLLAELFSVHKGKASYTLGWQIVPYLGAGRTYRFATGGNLLALEPATGGRPVGYGQGTVTFGTSANVGTVDSVITLKSGHSLSVRGRWSCVTPPVQRSSVPTTLPLA